MYIFKQPGIGGQVVWHQDSSFLHTEPDSVVGLWLALEDATVENGCLWALPGGHLGALKSRFVRAPGGGVTTIVHDPSPWPDQRFVPLETPRGTLVVLHGRLPHGSAANRSARSTPLRRLGAPPEPVARSALRAAGNAARNAGRFARALAPRQRRQPFGPLAPRLFAPRHRRRLPLRGRQLAPARPRPAAPPAGRATAMNRNHAGSPAFPAGRRASARTGGRGRRAGLRERRFNLVPWLMNGVQD